MFPATYCLAFSNAFIPLKSQTMIHTAKNGQQEGNNPSAGWEQMEEIFVASSTGKGMDVIDMVQHEDSQRLRNSAVKDLLLDLALCLNTGSIVFFLCVT
ncbi:PREDICTED: uncharacterized protein C7orf34 homolog [Pygoscelis adeliae]|uniref:uncharacterized protein C7orf34 homolog n=1 Tax=Pygoscelis adeliae TaxID=9238 RepID=UPI0004F501D4|nr:PREDICTED: uncharacterized protein C7orf34 homolog [Pygoscelis adeliae]